MASVSAKPTLSPPSLFSLLPLRKSQPSITFPISKSPPSISCTLSRHLPLSPFLGRSLKLPSPLIPSLSPHPHLSILIVGSDPRPTVLISEKLDEARLELLRAFSNVDCSYNLSQQELYSKISNCDALIVRSGTKVTREVFEASRGQLKVVGRPGVGIDNFDL